MSALQVQCEILFIRQGVNWVWILKCSFPVMSLHSLHCTDLVLTKHFTWQKSQPLLFLLCYLYAWTLQSFTKLVKDNEKICVWLHHSQLWNLKQWCWQTVWSYCPVLTTSSWNSTLCHCMAETCAKTFRGSHQES